MSLGVFIQQHKRAAHHAVLLVSHSSNLDLVCEYFIYWQQATQAASSQRNSKHRISPRGRRFSRASSPRLFLFLLATPSLRKGLSGFIFPWQYFYFSFIEKHCQQHTLTISFSFLLQTMTTNHAHKSCSIIGKCTWWYDSFLSWDCKCFASWGFAFFSSFSKNNLGKEAVWSIKDGGATETLKVSWAHTTGFSKIHAEQCKFVALGFLVLCGTSNLENRQKY